MKIATELDITDYGHIIDETNEKVRELQNSGKDPLMLQFMPISIETLIRDILPEGMTTETLLELISNFYTVKYFSRQFDIPAKDIAEAILHEYLPHNSTRNIFRYRFILSGKFNELEQKSNFLLTENAFSIKKLEEKSNRVVTIHYDLVLSENAYNSGITIAQHVIPTLLRKDSRYEHIFNAAAFFKEVNIYENIPRSDIDSIRANRPLYTLSSTELTAQDIMNIYLSDSVDDVYGIHRTVSLFTFYSPSFSEDGYMIYLTLPNPVIRKDGFCFPRESVLTIPSSAIRNKDFSIVENHKVYSIPTEEKDKWFNGLQKDSPLWKNNIDFINCLKEVIER